MGTLEWEDIKEFYKEHFGISNWVVEMLANLDILTLCASGASNETISNFLEIPVDEIALVIKEVFDFPGWEKDLPINPYKSYKDDGAIEFYTLYSYPEFNWVEPDTLVSICDTMLDIEERINDEWI